LPSFEEARALGFLSPSVILLPLIILILQNVLPIRVVKIFAVRENSCAPLATPHLGANAGKLKAHTL